MSTWRMAGLNVTYSNKLKLYKGPWVNCYYVNYSNIAAKILRRALKSGYREEALKRGEPSIKFLYWVNGEALPPGQKPTVAEKEKR